jgi:hypothetical protein
MKKLLLLLLIATLPSSAGYRDLVNMAGDGLTTEGGIINPKLKVDTQYSIVINGDKLELNGDALTPGNSKYYGTNGSGTKGYFTISSGTVTSVNNGDAFSEVVNGTTAAVITINNGSIFSSSIFDTYFNLKSTTNLTEGTNLYYTAARANGEIAEAVGVTVQAWDTHLDDIAAITPGAENRIITSDGLGSWTVAAFSSLDTNTNANTICSGTTTYLDGEGNCDDISSVYQASDSDLTAIAALSPSNGELIYGLNGAWTLLQNGSDNQVLTVNGAILSWQTAASGSSEWTDNGSNLYPSELTDTVSIGQNFSFGLLNLNGDIAFDSIATPTLDMMGDYPRVYIKTSTGNLTFLKWDGTTQTEYDLVPGASVSGPGSSTDTAVALWSGAGGGTLQDSVVLIDSMGGITGADSIALAGSMGAPLTVATSALVVDSSGNVGIGTASPDQSFKVTRDMYTTGDTYFANNKFIKWADSGAMGNNSIIGVNSSDQVIIQSFDDMMGNGQPIIFKSKPSLGETMRVTTDGFLGVGDTTPVVMLDVAGDIQAQESIFFDAEVDDGNSSTADTIDWSIGNHHKSTMTGNCTYTFTAPAGPTTVTLKIVQDGTGSRTATWPGSVKWATAGTAPTLSTAAASIDFISCYYDGTNYYCASNLDFQ